MTKNVFTMALLWVMLMLLQVICLRICLWNVAMPVVFIYFLLRLPIKMSINAEFTLAFFTGLAVDLFADTPGMNAVACLLLALLRRPVFSLYFSRGDDMPDSRPSAMHLGFEIYAKYMFTLTFVYCAILFGIQAFSSGLVLLTLERIFFSGLLSSVLIMGIESMVVAR